MSDPHLRMNNSCPVGMPSMILSICKINAIGFFKFNDATKFVLCLNLLDFIFVSIFSICLAVASFRASL